MSKSVMTFEFGTSKVICAIGKKRARGRFEIASMAQANYAGLKKGRWLDLERVPEVLTKTYTEAKAKTRFNGQDIYAGIPPVFCRVHCASTAMDLIGNNKVVTTEMVNRMQQSALKFDVPDEYELVEVRPVYFKINDKSLYIDPVDVEANRIEGQFSFIFAKKRFLYEAQTMLDVLNIKVTKFIPEVLSQALFLVPVGERDSSSILLDVGFYDTALNVVYGDAIIFSRSIPVGGAQIASDLAQVLNIEMESAERIKRRFTFDTIHYRKGAMETIRENGDLKEFEKQMISDIVTSRVDHLLALAAHALNNSAIDLPSSTKLYLTGAGVTMMKGSGAYFESKLKYATQLPQIEATNYATPNYHNAIGLLDFILANDDKHKDS